LFVRFTTWTVQFALTLLYAFAIITAVPVPTARIAPVFALTLIRSTVSKPSESRSAMRADVNFDGKVTLNELFNYTSRRVMWYLEITGNLAGDPGAYVQNVKVYPEGDTTPLFERP